jgi:predicted MFS family arabinose efflux permease
MWVLLIAGIAGGLSTDYNWVLAARVIEGLAAGVVQPIPAIIILRAFDTSEQGRANSFFGMGVVLAPALGPSIGGLLVDWMSWRALFFMVVPFCTISMWMAMRYVPTTAPGGVSANHGKPSLDLGGLALATVGTLCFLNGLVMLHSGNVTATCANAKRWQTVDELGIVCPSPICHGHHRGLHLRHCNVWLHLFAAFVFAAGFGFIA